MVHSSTKAQPHGEIVAAGAEAALRRREANEDAWKHAADPLLRDAKGLAHNAFKIDLGRRAIVRALTQAANGTPQSQSDKQIR